MITDGDILAALDRAKGADDRASTREVFTALARKVGITAVEARLIKLRQRGIVDVKRGTGYVSADFNRYGRRQSTG